MMNILFFTQFPIIPSQGGVQRVTDILAREFQHKGLNVLYMTTFVDADKEDYNSLQYFLPVRDISAKNNVDFLTNFLNDHKIGFVINQAGIYRHIIQFLSNVISANIGLITVHHNTVFGLNTHYKDIVIAENRTTLKWKLLNFSLFWDLMRFRHKIKYGNYLKEAIKASDYMVFLSENFVEELPLYNVAVSHKTIAINNPTSFDVQEINFCQKENRICFIGRLTVTQKRVDRLMRILKILHEKLPNYKFDICGDGSSHKFVNDFIENNNLYRVVLHGFINPEEVLQKSKFLILPSDFEGFGMVLIEAQAFGVIPIAFNCYNGIKEVINHPNAGFVIPDFDENSLIEKIIELTKDTILGENISKNAKLNVKRFNTSKIADEWISLFKKIK